MDEAVQSGLRSPEFHEQVGAQENNEGFTLRGVICGLLIGILINLSNTYYGLQIGAAAQMPILSALLGYIIFKSLSRYISTPFTANENVLVISVATATGCMPVTGGFTVTIPALEYLITPEEGGPIHVGPIKLLLWSFGLCFFGLIFAALLREYFVVQESLPWPGPKATAHLINTLHHRSEIPYTPVPTHDDAPGTSADEDHEPFPGESTEVDWKNRMSGLLRGSAISGIFTIFMYFVPILRAVPIFGPRIASHWLWTADLSPGFFGQGIITGPAIPLHMLTGAIVGWGILSPMAKQRGWAPGDVDSWIDGSRGWIIWISMAAMLSDALANMACLLIRSVWRTYSAKGHLQHNWTTLRISSIDENSPNSRQNESCSLLVADGTVFSHDLRMKPSLATPSFLQSPVSSRLLGLSFIATIIICTLGVQIVYGQLIPWYYTILAVILSLPMAVMGIRSLAETDYNPHSRIVAQLVFAGLISHSTPNAVVMNVLSAGISSAGAMQAGDMAYDFKIGHLVGAQPQAQLYGQIVGSLFGAFISFGIYRLYSSQYPIPGPLFRIPGSFLNVSSARLLMGEGLPEGVAPFGIAFGIIFAVITLVKTRYAERSWQQFIPSGAAFAAGVYNPPSYTIARVMGGVFYWFYCRLSSGQERGSMMVLASGLILGESVASLVNLGLRAAGVPQLKS